MKTILLSLAIALATTSVTAQTSKAVSKEILCKAFTVYKEAGAESMAGKRAVLDVIENRMRLRDMKACQIMSQKGQFSFYSHGMKVTAKSVPKKALTDYFIVANMRRVLSRDVEYFHNRSVKPKWTKKLKRVARIGGHIFYE